MDPLARPDLLSLLVHIVGTGLFAGVFLFLYRESRILYFGYWSLAWTIVGAALLFHLASVLTGRRVLLFPYVLLELAFATSIIFAAASVFGRFDIRLSSAVVLVPLVAVTAYATGLLSDFNGFYALNSLLLTAAYVWNFIVFRRRWRARHGHAGKLFGAALLASALFYANYAFLYAAAHAGRSGSTPAYLRYHDLCDLMFETLLAFSAMMIWMESQNEQLQQLNAELDRSRSEIASRARLDTLTGLLNRKDLDEKCESEERFSGCLAVLDLDNFKDVNDALGHVTGDEVLANVGNLIKSSVRKNDLAWRWGGDEFVLLFRDQSRETVESRIRSLEQRLLRFRIRGRGVLPIQLSWGVAELGQPSIRAALAEADEQMYLKKREKSSSSKSKFFSQ